MSKQRHNGTPRHREPTTQRPARRSPQSSVGVLERPRGKQEHASIMGEIDDQTSGLAAIAAASLHSTATRDSHSDSNGTTKTKQTKPATRQAPMKLPPRKSKSHDLKATAAPLLGTVGVLLLVPAFWAVMVLIGWSVPGAAREDSHAMAAVMLVSWPIAICLLAAAGFFFMQLRREKKRLAKSVGPRNAMP